MNLGSSLAIEFLIPSVGGLAFLVLGLVVGLAFRGRGGDRARASATSYVFYGISLVALMIGFLAFGIGANAVAHAVGPQTNPNLGAISGLPQCSDVNGGSSNGGTLTPCVNSSGSAVFPAGSGSVGNSGVTIGGSPTRNGYISDAVEAFLFYLAAIGAYAATWPRVRRHRRSATSEAEDRLGVNYSHLVIGLSTVVLLILLPVAADQAFRALAPGITNAGGRAPGVRALIALLLVSAGIAANLVYHLRLTGLAGPGRGWISGRAGPGDHRGDEGPDGGAGGVEPYPIY